MSILYPKSRIVIELQREIPVCRTRSQQGLGQARPNKNTSETRKSLRSEVPVEHKIFKNWKFVATLKIMWNAYLNRSILILGQMDLEKAWLFISETQMASSLKWCSRFDIKL